MARAIGGPHERHMQDKKLLVILRYVRDHIEPGRDYSEKEVNAVIARFHPDTASLRRAMIDCGLMKREAAGGKYWRAETAGN